MSAVDAIGGSSNPTSAGGSGLSALTSGEFLNIILTELQAQDPLEPQNTEALLNQFATLYQIESDIKLGDSLGSLVDQNEFTAASMLIGSLVSGISLDNRRVAEIVVSVSNTEDGPVLNLYDGSRVLFSNVDEVAGVVNVDDGSGDDAGDDTDGAGGETGGPDDAGGTAVTPDDADAAGSAAASGSGSDSAGGAAESRASTGDRIDRMVAAIKERFK